MIKRNKSYNQTKLIQVIKAIKQWQVLKVFIVNCRIPLIMRFHLLLNNNNNLNNLNNKKLDNISINLKALGEYLL